MSNGGILGQPNIPTSTAANGRWTPNEVNAQINGATQGLFWPGAQDSLYSSVVYLSHFKDFLSVGPSGHPALLDHSSKGNHLPFNPHGGGGSVAGGFSPISKFGSQSYLGDTTGNGTTFFKQSVADFSMGTGDFTLEAWINPNNGGFTMAMFDFRPTQSLTTGPSFHIDTANKLFFSMAGAVDKTGTNAISNGVWSHVHATRDTGVTYMGLNGTQEGTDLTDATNYNTDLLYLLSYPATTGLLFIGAVAEVRITKGVARYARTYTVPTEPFPDY